MCREIKERIEEKKADQKEQKTLIVSRKKYLSHSFIWSFMKNLAR
jgi:hypothetical protein